MVCGHTLGGAGGAHPERTTLLLLHVVLLPRKLLQQILHLQSGRRVISWSSYWLVQLLCISREGSRGRDQPGRGQEQCGGMRSSFFGDGAVVTHPFPPRHREPAEPCRLKSGLQPAPSLRCCCLGDGGFSAARLQRPNAHCCSLSPPSQRLHPWRRQAGTALPVPWESSSKFPPAHGQCPGARLVLELLSASC